MKRTIFTKSTTALILTLLVLGAFFPKGLSQKLMAGAIILWLAILCGQFLIRHSGRGLRRISLHKIRTFVSGKYRAEKCTAESPPPVPEPTDFHMGECSYLYSEQEVEMMLCHISLRITDKLKSAYPQAVWQWKQKPSLKDILAGATLRIAVDDMEKYNHADICFDRFGRIHVQPLVVGSFQPSAQDTPPEPENEEPKVPSVVDVSVWYELVGQKVLESLITELNAGGHTRLTIKENGDVVIRQNKKELLKATLENFPGRNYWEELISTLEENELKARIAGDALQVSWV